MGTKRDGSANRRLHGARSTMSHHGHDRFGVFFHTKLKRSCSRGIMAFPDGGRSCSLCKSPMWHFGPSAVHPASPSSLASSLPLPPPRTTDSGGWPQRARTADADFRAALVLWRPVLLELVELVVLVVCLSAAAAAHATVHLQPPHGGLWVSQRGRTSQT